MTLNLRCTGPRRLALVVLPAAAWLLAAHALHAQPVPAMQVAPPGAMPMTSPPTLVGRFEMIGAPDGPTFIGPVRFTGRSGNPVPSYSALTGLQLKIEADWPGQYGYRPLELTLSQAKPAAASKRVRFRFFAGDWPLPPQAITVENEIELPAGATAVSARLSVPQFHLWQICGWDVLVDGQRDADLSVEWTNYADASGAGATTYAVTIAGFVDKGRIEAGFQGSPTGSVLLRTVLPAQLPTVWVDYTPIDLFVLPATQFAELARRQPPQAEALLDWVRSGGNLWLLNAGRHWQELPSIETALKAEREAIVAGNLDAEDARNADAAIVRRGWRFAPLGGRAAEPIEGVLALANATAENAPARPATTAETSGLPPVAPTSREWFAVRPYGMGVVTAFRAELQGGQFPRSELAMTAVSQSLLAPRLQWASRHGNQPDAFNAEFNNFLIPNVGVAPVGQFQFLITLFVLAIGPLNYWLLKRSNKLPMLLVTVPAAALATTALLFAYGLLGDGLGVRARVRSFTLLDQGKGEAVSWGRLSYYAGIAPRGGLTVASDAVMYPILPRWAISRRFGRSGHRSPREVVWADQQRLTQGWLASRTPTQYLSIASRRSAKRLDMRATDAGLRVTNRLGADVTHLAVQDHAGRRYWCEDLADGQRKVYPPADENAAAVGIRRLFTDNIPEFPPGSDEGVYSGGYFGLVLSQNLMEAQLEAINSPLLPSWGDGTYVAFTKRAVELEVGVDDAEEEASFHVIRGTW